MPRMFAFEPEHGALIAVAAGVLGGMLFARLVRSQDHRTWVLARAPQLPIRALGSGDDAWITGTVRSRKPLQCPWFDVACVAYDYSVEIEVVTTHRDKDGNVRVETSWQTEAEESEAIDFDLDDGAAIRVCVADADNQALDELDTDYETSARRHNASVIEVGAELTALGVRQDDGTFAREREVPLLLTRKTAKECIASSAGSETALFTLAWVWPFLCAFGTVAILQGDPGWRQPAALLFAALAGVALALPFWAILTHNRLVRLRQQVQAAFRQVDVDLAVRAELVPNLVAVVKAGTAHEQDLLRDLATIRSGGDPHAAVGADAAARAVARQVLVLHERYPQLKADALYRDLHERLWAVEEKLQHTRSLYNDVVTEWNVRIAKFPSVLVARLSGCRAAPLFAGDDAPLPPPLTNRDA